jgi:hypothetical protein
LEKAKSPPRELALVYRPLCQNLPALRRPVIQGHPLALLDRLVLPPFLLREKVNKRASSLRVKVLAHLIVVHHLHSYVISVTYMGTPSVTVVRRTHCIILILTNKLVVNLIAGNKWLWTNWRTVYSHLMCVLGAYNLIAPPPLVILLKILNFILKPHTSSNFLIKYAEKKSIKEGI